MDAPVASRLMQRACEEFDVAGNYVLVEWIQWGNRIWPTVYRKVIDGAAADTHREPPAVEAILALVTFSVCRGMLRKRQLD